MAEPTARTQRILSALADEIERQAGTDLEEIDLMALAIAVDHALDRDGAADPVTLEVPGDDYDDGKRPSELNSSNDI